MFDKYKLEVMLDNDMPEIIKEYYARLESENNTRTDSGIDLPVTKDYNINNKCRETFNFKIKCQMIGPKGNFIPYYLYPRSSISKTPLILANSVGIIDKDYRGNLMAKVLSIESPDYCDRESYKVDKGTRLFQICTPDLSPIGIKIVSELTSTSRGDGGFGSTGTSV